MSHLSGFDSEAVGFDSLGRTKRAEASSGTQTSEFAAVGAATQTGLLRDCGVSVTAGPPDSHSQGTVPEYPPPGLNEFLRRVVPAMLQQLDEAPAPHADSSDDEEEPLVHAKLVQEIQVADGIGAGDGSAPSCVLALSWGADGALAAAVGGTQHEQWCAHAGLVREYTPRLQRRGEHADTSCVTALHYHPTVAGLLAYGTSSGTLVVMERSERVSRAAHGSQRVSALQWAQRPLAELFLVNTGGRRGYHVLVTAGSDGTINVWQVSCSSQVFDTVVCYAINSSAKGPAPDISCFQFGGDGGQLFVVGSTAGALYVCGVRNTDTHGKDMTDPVVHAAVPHGCGVVWAEWRPRGRFLSISGDGELREYDARLRTPLKVYQLERGVSCAAWLGRAAVLGCARPPGALLWAGRLLPTRGLDTPPVTAVAVHRGDVYRVACGSAQGTVRVFELPLRLPRAHDDDDDDEL